MSLSRALVELTVPYADAEVPALLRNVCDEGRDRALAEP